MCSLPPRHPSFFISRVLFTTVFALKRGVPASNGVYLFEFRSKSRCIWRWRVLWRRSRCRDLRCSSSRAASSRNFVTLLCFRSFRFAFERTRQAHVENRRRSIHWNRTKLGRKAWKTSRDEVGKCMLLHIGPMGHGFRWELEEDQEEPLAS